jgi:hypothetical protein
MGKKAVLAEVLSAKSARRLRGGSGLVAWVGSGQAAVSTGCRRRLVSVVQPGDAIRARVRPPDQDLQGRDREAVRLMCLMLGAAPGHARESCRQPCLVREPRRGVFLLGACSGEKISVV